MDRFFAEVLPEGFAYIEKDFGHFRVKRVKVGDPVEVLDERTLKPYRGRVERVERRRAVVKVVEEVPPNVPKAFVRLYQCVPVKLSTFDEIVEKSTELGVSEIVPVISKRSFQKVSAIREKVERWERVAREALKQCGRHVPPKILPPLALEDINPEADFLNLFPFEREETKNLWEVLGETETPKGANIVVGPEGGFAAEEAQILVQKGFLPVSLGNFILRSETAAALAAGMVYNKLVSGRR